MTHSYTIAGMTCTGCAAGVKGKLLMNSAVTGAEVSLENHSATITMQRHLTVEELQNTLGLNSKYRISEAPVEKRPALEAPSKSWIATYKPLLLIFAFIVGVSALTSVNAGTINGGLFMNTFMAGFFIVFSFFKLLDLKGFSKSYSQYDLLAIRWNGYGVVYPFIELGLGIAYLIRFDPLPTAIATVIVMGFSSIGVIIAVVHRKKIDCACLGAVFNLPMSTVTIVEDLLMVLMAGVFIAKAI